MELDNSIIGKIVTIRPASGNFFERSRYSGIRVLVLRQRMCGHYEVEAVDPYDERAEDIGGTHFGLDDFMIESEPAAKIGEATSKKWYGIVAYNKHDEPSIIKSYFIDEETADIIKSIFDVAVYQYAGEEPEFFELTDAAKILQ